jgi:hypothetical protein
LDVNTISSVNKSLKEACGALIYAKNTGRYLFVLRDGSKYAGSWGLVGGKLESGELITEALYREIREEIGIDLSTVKTIPIETFTSDNNGFVYYTYVISVDNEFIPILNKEHTGYAWTSLKDHPKPLHPGLWRSFNFKVIQEKIKVLEQLL